MKKAVSNNARNWNYTSAILKDCLNKNIKTIEQFEASQLEFKNKKNNEYSSQKNEKEKRTAKIKILEESQTNEDS